MWGVTGHLDLELWVSLEWLSYLPSFLFSILILSVFFHCHKTLSLNITICKAGFKHLFWLLFFCHTTPRVGSQFPNQGLNPGHSSERAES